MFSWQKFFSNKQKTIKNDKRNWKPVNKRASFFTSQKGSMTLEASLILPLFLIVLLLCISAAEFFMIHGQVAHGLKEAAVEAATKEYAISRSKIKGQTVQKGIAKATFLSSVNQKFLNGSGLVGGSGGVALTSQLELNSNGEYEVSAKYVIQKKMPFLPTIRGVFTQKIKQKAMTGYEPKGDTDSKEMVYVTPHESVYHTDLSCTHLSLSISVDSQVEKYLQGKTSYKPCEKCTNHHSGPVSSLYVAKEGDAYHTDIGCSGLKRTVTIVDKESVKGRKPCERCGK